MARLAPIPEPDFCGGVRCRSARRTDNSGVAESFRLFPAKGANTLRNRSDQRRLAMATWFWTARKTKGMDLQSEESVSTSAFRSLHVSRRGSHHSRFVANVRRVCGIPRQTFFRSGERRES